MTLGYRTLRLTQPCLLGPAGTVLRGHEFHYSQLEADRRTAVCLRASGRGRQAGRDRDGVMRRNTLALYSHQHFASCPEVVEPSARGRASRATGRGFSGKRMT
jgi:cobyrinic acid a,c-diamide synthase